MSFTSTALSILSVEIPSRPGLPPRRLFHDRSGPLDQTFSVAETRAIKRNRVQPCAYGDCGARACELVDFSNQDGREVERVRCLACARGFTRIWLPGETQGSQKTCAELRWWWPSLAWCWAAD